LNIVPSVEDSADWVLFFIQKYASSQISESENNSKIENPEESPSPYKQSQIEFMEHLDDLILLQ
jgi:hypothetical protein